MSQVTNSRVLRNSKCFITWYTTIWFLFPIERELSIRIFLSDHIFCKLWLNMTSLTHPSNIFGIRCSSEFCTTSSSLLLDEDKLLKHQVLPFMQLYPCYHSFCLRCFSTYLLASSCASMLQCSIFINDEQFYHYLLI